jgi:hypothetical protein
MLKALCKSQHLVRMSAAETDYRVHILSLFVHLLILSHTIHHSLSSGIAAAIV